MSTTTVLPPNGSVTDRRRAHLPNTDTVFDPPIPRYATVQEWERRKAELRVHILVAAGLFPLPARCPLDARTTGRIEGNGFVVENVYFQTYPGFYCTGNLYRPREGEGPFPGVASPHGHWANGRLHHAEAGSIPARGITLARQGCVVFCYDMVGYNDSQQIGHKFEGDREYLWGVSLLGLQLWNSIRVLDFLESLDDVDNDRLACTGASGGGTQTFLLTAVDERVKVAAPVNMVSAHMQGGCLCENAPHLRLNATNVEIAAMAAPRPMLMVSATGDWTKNTPTVEYPAVREIYRLYGAEDRVHNVHIDAGHNYNLASREAVYAWFGKWLRREEDASTLREAPFDLPPVETMRVFPAGLPSGALSGDAVVERVIGLAQAQYESLLPVDAESLERARTLLGAAFGHTFNVSLPDAVDARAFTADGRIEPLVLSRPGVGDSVPAVWLHTARPTNGVAVLVHEAGKQACLSDDGNPAGLAARLLEAAYDVLAVDVFHTGETAHEERPAGRHFFTFNPPDLALRVQDILTAIAYGRERAGRVHLVGEGAAGIWALFARAFAPSVEATVADMGGRDLADDGAFEGDLFLPGIRRAGDVITAGILAAPGRLHLHNVHDSTDLTGVFAAYLAAGAVARLTVSSGRQAADQVVAWLAAS
jgi:dienelactone hydrolase